MLQIVHYHNKGNSKPLFKIIRTKNVTNIGYKILVKGTRLRPGRTIKKMGGGEKGIGEVRFLDLQHMSPAR